MSDEDNNSGSMSEDVTINVKGLDNLLKALGGKQPVARVGILGDNAVRGSGASQGVPSNAQIGAWHEFGTVKSPVRSFLRMPLSVFLGKRLTSAGFFKEDVLKQVIDQKSMVPWVRKIGILAEAIVQEAFDTAGFGSWPPSDMRGKKNHMTLVETTQLRNSITSDVKENG